MSILRRYELMLLVEKQGDGNCTDAEEVLLTEWFEEVETLEELTFFSENEKESIKNEISARIKEKISELPSDRGKMQFRLLLLRTAAAILLLGIFTERIYYYSKTLSSNKLITVTTPRSVSKMSVTLPDSSLVWLYSGSSLTYAKEFSTYERNVTLNGIAFFSVKPDSNAKFVVKAKSVSISVLGTSFVVDVQKEQQYIQISVITGRVQIDDKRNKLGPLQPGESLSYSCIDKTFSKRNYLSEEISAFNESGIIYVNTASLDELAILLQTLYKIDLVYDKAETTRYRFYMSFTRGLAVDDVLGMLETTSGLDFVRNGNTVIVSK